MGVTSLWTVVQPCARPIKLETLNKKRLAVDASIWIYQFLKAVRDKEGNALRNSHVVGFFRRICKLLYIGIKPVFVFDGGAPALKRQTVAGRRKRREGRREDAVRTAGKLLAVQMQRRAEEDERKRKEDRYRDVREQEEELPEELVYVGEQGMTAKERQQNRSFRKKDQYHLPELDVAMSEMGAPNDPRVMSQEELEDYARQFHSGEDINLYDFSKIDFNSPFFLSLPAGDRYNILNAARLRSRLRMGYSKDQLDRMFPNRMEFSKFQVERVRERNELTQRLMNITGMSSQDGTLPGVNMGGRIAGEKGREYVLVKNDGVEGGWALGVVSNNNVGKSDQPIDVEGYGEKPKAEEDEDDLWEEEDDFEDVPIEGLNRLPKSLKRTARNLDLDSDESYRAKEIAEKRRVVYDARRQAAQKQEEARQRKAGQPYDEEGADSLFVVNNKRDNRTDGSNDGPFADEELHPDEDEDLRRAIETSLEKPEDEDRSSPPESIQDSTLRFDRATANAGKKVGESLNNRARRPNIRQTMFEDDDDEEDEDFEAGFDLQTVLAESRSPRYQTSTSRQPRLSSPARPSGDNPFGGPLPFESISLGKSILRKKKRDEEESGGFERDHERAPKKKPSPKPLPPWFAGERSRDSPFAAANSDANEDSVREEHEYLDHPILNRVETGEVINVDSQQSKEIIDVDSQPTKEVIDVDALGYDLKSDSEVIDVDGGDDKGLTMNDLAEFTRANPPISKEENSLMPELETSKVTPPPDEQESEPEEIVEWSESDREEEPGRGPISMSVVNNSASPTRSTSEELENAAIEPQLLTDGARERSISPQLQNVPIGDSSSADSIKTPPPEPPPMDDGMFDDLATSFNPPGDFPYEANFEDGYSDPEDEELMLQLAQEAEEHARFAASLNQQSQAVDYDKELRQLRNQQKKDRRDADEVTQIMITECQQLLKQFGLPYITAPMEAEAQCAELVHLGLVDGIVTDDSDIFLFGGTRVYKNLFNQGKYVECYLSTDLEKEYGLDRQKLIRFAHLLGSDYTEGIPGVGPVTALEILTEFSTLETFRDWWQQVQMGAKLPGDTHSTFRRKFKRNAAKLFLPPAFPDLRVDQAYLQPEVDSDPSQFQWGVPDLDSLRSFLMATIGWTSERTDEVLVPVIRDMNRRENEGTQSNITTFFGGGVGAGAFAPRVKEKGASGRMEKAFGRLREQALQKMGKVAEVGDVPGDVEADAAALGDRNESTQSAPKSWKKTKKRKSAGKEKKKSTRADDDESTAMDQRDFDDDDDVDEDADGDETYSAARKWSKRRRKGQEVIGA